MDANLNDIKVRMERIYLALGQRFDTDFENQVQIKHEFDAKRGKISISFGDDNKADILNQIFLIISHLAKLKDHLKKIHIQKGGQGDVIENEINQSEYLCLIIDLDNLEKHGQGRESRSGKYPHIEDVSRGITPINGTSGSFIINPVTGEFKPDNVAIVVSGSVKDKEGNIICGVNELINKSMDKWEEVIKKYNLTSLE